MYFCYSIVINCQPFFAINELNQMLLWSTLLKNQCYWCNVIYICARILKKDVNLWGSNWLILYVSILHWLSTWQDTQPMTSLLNRICTSCVNLGLQWECVYLLTTDSTTWLQPECQLSGYFEALSQPFVFPRVICSPEHWALVLCVPPSPPHRTIQCCVFRIYHAGFMNDLFVVWFLCFYNSTNGWISFR